MAKGGDLSGEKGRAVHESVTGKGKEQLEEMIFLPLQKGYSKSQLSSVQLAELREGAESLLLP